MVTSSVTNEEAMRGKEIYSGKYKVIKMLGEGTTSKVYLVRNELDDKLYAMKVCRDTILLQQESELLRKLAHPAFPRWIDYFVEDEGFLVMEYVEGITLQELVKAGGRLELRQTMYIMEEILSCLAYLHNRKPAVVYRDLKPANIIISKDGEVRLVDVGGAMEEEGKTLAQARPVTNTIDGEGTAQVKSVAKETAEKKYKMYKVGTYGYAAPEQFWDGIRPGPECDLYAAGKILAYLLTGKDPCEPPYDMVSYCSRNREVTAEFFRVIQRSLANESMGRYATAEEFMRDLKAAGKQKWRRKWGIFAKKQKILYEKCIWKSEYQRIF